VEHQATAYTRCKQAKEKEQNIGAFYVLQAYYIDIVKQTIEEEYGNIELYLTDGLGLSENEILSLREKMLQ
jgi:protein tyrosine/serine phosphatase